ncbi:MAG: hypothetical protein AAFR51_16575 [Pseudomonadota bacterium]
MAFALLTACATQGSPRDGFTQMVGSLAFKWDRMTEVERREAERSEAWDKLVFRSEVRSIGNDRLEIKAKGALGNGIQKVEDMLLARAAAETVREGYDGFYISYLTYESEFPLHLTNGFISFPETVEITTYEAFLSYSKEQRMMMSASAIGFKKIRCVIVMVKHGAPRIADYFNAEELFENLISTGF